MSGDGGEKEVCANGAKRAAVVAALKKEILGGKYAAPNAQFPSERSLARRFGVSRLTVSTALQELRGKGLLFREQGRGTFLTRSARKLGGAVGLIVPGASYAEVFPPICHEISRLAQNEGLTLLFGDIAAGTPADRARQALALARKFAAERVSGVVFQPLEQLEDAAKINSEITGVFVERKIPLVLIDADIEQSPERSAFDLVSVNAFDAGRRLARHLAAAGARCLHVLTEENWANSIRNRTLGVRSEAALCGAHVTEGSADVSDPAAVARLFRKRPAPDAILCRNDVVAAHLMVTLRKIGRRVPDDVMVTGFNDLTYASILEPPLTTIHMPCADIAATAFRMLMARISNPSLPVRECLLPAPLVPRGSTAAARGR